MGSAITRRPQSGPGQIRDQSMKHVSLAAAAALIVAAGSAYAQPNPPEPERPGFSNSASSATQLKALLEDWDRAGFTTPSKPSQYRVYARGLPPRPRAGSPDRNCQGAN